MSVYQEMTRCARQRVILTWDPDCSGFWLVRDYFPAREAGTRISLVMMATLFGMSLGGWMSGVIYDLTGSYQAAFLNGIAWNLLNMSIAFWLLLGRIRPQRAPA